MRHTLHRRLLAAPLTVSGHRMIAWRRPAAASVSQFSVKRLDNKSRCIDKEFLPVAVRCHALFRLNTWVCLLSFSPAVTERRIPEQKRRNRQG